MIMGRQKKTTHNAEQLSIFEQVFEKLANGGDLNVTSDELIKIIEHLVAVKNETIKKEALPVSAEHCKIVPAVLGDSIGDYAALGVAKICAEGLKNE